MFHNPGIGLAHLVIFWAFLFYAASFAWNLVRGLFPFLPIPYADEVAWMRFPMELITVAAIVALAGAAIRRYVFTPQRLGRSRDATLILILISLLLVTFLVGQGAKAAGEEGAVSWSPVGGLIGGWLGGLSAAGAESLFLAMWWAHMVAVLAFLASLLSSKHLHLLASPSACSPPRWSPGGCLLPPRGPDAWRSSPGGSCTTVWPAPSAAAATGRAPLSPPEGFCRLRT